jgi:hypothetical protein
VGVGRRWRARAFVHVALLIQHATRIHIVCGLSGSTTVFDIISNGTIFMGKKVSGHEMCIFDFPYNLYLKLFSFYGECKNFCI